MLQALRQQVHQCRLATSGRAHHTDEIHRFHDRGNILIRLGHDLEDQVLIFSILPAFINHSQPALRTRRLLIPSGLATDTLGARDYMAAGVDARDGACPTCCRLGAEVERLRLAGGSCLAHREGGRHRIVVTNEGLDYRCRWIFDSVEVAWGRQQQRREICWLYIPLVFAGAVTNGQKNELDAAIELNDAACLMRLS